MALDLDGRELLVADRDLVGVAVGPAAQTANGDHTLYVGRVRAFRARPGRPLLFESGQFARLANEPLITSWGW